jgi:hypothetical protein
MSGPSLERLDVSCRAALLAKARIPAIYGGEHVKILKPLAACLTIVRDLEIRDLRVRTRERLSFAPGHGSDCGEFCAKEPFEER